MIKFKSVSAYQPKSPLAQDYEHFRKKSQDLEEAKKQLEKKSLEIQQELALIVPEIATQLEQHRFANTPVFMFGVNVSPFPVKRYAVQLRSALENTISPAKVLLILETCIDEYISNRLAPDFEMNLMLALEHQPTVDKAHAVGQTLQKDLVDPINKLKAMQQRLEPYERAVVQARKDLEDSNPIHLHQERLDLALISAFEAIRKEADAIANDGKDKRAIEAGGIRGLCGELLKNSGQDLTKLIDGYTTLRNRVPNGYADAKLTAIKAIFDAHRENHQLLSQSSEHDFEINPEDNIPGIQPVESRDIRNNNEVTSDPREQAIDELGGLIATYLHNREKYTQKNNDKEEVKEYFYPFFTSFQKSYTEKKEAIDRLFAVLEGRADCFDASHVSTLRNGTLGKTLRSFIKEGKANAIVGKEVSTIREFLKYLSEKAPHHEPNGLRLE